MIVEKAAGIVAHPLFTGNAKSAPVPVQLVATYAVAISVPTGLTS